MPMVPSSTPVTVTCWATFQVVAVKESVAGATVPSVTVSLERAMLTGPSGWDLRTTVKVAVVPGVVAQVVGATVMPTLSSSTLTTDTVLVASAAYLASAPEALSDTVYDWLPSATFSSTPVTVTVCGVDQLLAVNVSEAGATVPSLVALLEAATVTLAVGCEPSATVNVTLVPASVVSKSPGTATFSAALSSLVFELVNVTVTLVVG